MTDAFSVLRRVPSKNQEQLNELCPMGGRPGPVGPIIIALVSSLLEVRERRLLKNDDEDINHYCDDEKTRSVGETKKNVCPLTYYSGLKQCRRRPIIIWLERIVMELTLILPCHRTQLKKE